MTNVYRIFVEAAAGATVHQVAKDAYAIAEKLGMAHDEVILMHNEQFYIVDMQVTHIATPTSMQFRLESK